MNYNNVIAERRDKIIYRDGDKAIKCFSEQYSKAEILNEAMNHARIEDTDIKVPKLISVSQIEEKWAITTEFIEGKTLEDMLNDETELSNIERLMNMFIDIQLEVISKNVLMLNSLNEKIKRKLTMVNLDATINYNVMARLESLEKGDKVCHGDFNPSNIVIREDGAYILDWAHVTSGNPLFDIAMTTLLFKLSKKEDLENLYVNTISSRLGISLQEIKRWLPIAAVSKLNKVKNEEDRAILMSYLESMVD